MSQHTSLGDVKLSPQIMQDMIAFLVAQPDNPLSDFNESSVTYDILEAFARELEKLYLKMRGGVDQITDNLARLLFDFPKKEGSYAAGQVSFTLEAPLTRDFTIHAGTPLVSSNGQSYQTTENLVINAGRTRGTIGAVATERGADSNAGSLTVNVIGTTLAEEVAVNNILPFTGGKDTEDRTQYFIRFAEYIKGLSGHNESYYKSTAMTLDGVQDALPITYVPPVDIEGQLYNMVLYIDDGAATVNDENIRAVKRAILGEDTPDSPGIVSAGVACYITPAQKYNYSLAATVSTDGLVSISSVRDNVETAVANYINGLSIGADVVLSSLIKLIREIPNVVDICINEPGSNTTIAPSQVAKLASLSLKMEIA